jgi:hypothetical protein
MSFLLSNINEFSMETNIIYRMDFVNVDFIDGKKSVYLFSFLFTAR